MREPEEWTDEDFFLYDQYEIGSETDAEALASAGFGTDEDYRRLDEWDDENGYRY